MKQQRTKGHISALFTELMWGNTFISTKILLGGFHPVEILFMRFILGVAALFLAFPRRMKGTTARQEASFALAGLLGVSLYYLLENIALTYTLASNAGVIISVAPFFTGILSYIFFKEEEKPGKNFFVGFLVAIAGIACISFNGSSMQLNPLGDFLTLLTAFVWACYSITTKKISAYGYPTVLVTRRIFCYGILFMIPALFVFDLQLGLSRFTNPVYLINMLFLGLGASALGFVTWNYAVKVLGAVTTSIYFYLGPVITVVSSWLILREPVTRLTIAGTVLTLSGLILSQRRT